MRFTILFSRLISIILVTVFLFSGVAAYAAEVPAEPVVGETARPEPTVTPDPGQGDVPAPDGTPSPEASPNPGEDPEEGKDKPTGRKCYTVKKVKLYKARKTGARVLKSLRKNEEVYEISVRGEWSKVKYKKKTGYIKTKFLTSEAPAPVEGEINVDVLGEIGEPGGLTELDKSKKQASNWAGQIVLGEGGMSIPQLFQFDFPQVVCTYNGKPRSARSSGCSMTSLSMIVAYLKGNLEQNPYTLFREACQLGLYHGDGLGHEAILTMASRYGIAGTWRSMDAEALVATLKSGTPVIAHMGEGLFTEGGHYIVLRGVTEDGKILVNDPASAERTKMAYPVALFMAECKTSTPFMLCSIADKPKETPAQDAGESKAAPQKDSPDEKK